MEIPIELLCYSVPKEFATYFSYVRSLEFEEEPDYNFIRKLFRDLAERERIDWNYIFDWAKMTGDASAMAVRPTRKK